VSVDALGLYADEDVSAVILPTVEEHVAQAVKSSSSPFILHPPQQTASKRIAE
jgi:hypothetical protein